MLLLVGSLRRTGVTDRPHLPKIITSTANDVTLLSLCGSKEPNKQNIFTNTPKTRCSTPSRSYLTMSFADALDLS